MRCGGTAIEYVRRIGRENFAALTNCPPNGQKVSQHERIRETTG